MSAAEATAAPDVPGTVELWRAWRVVQCDDGYQLGSVLKPTLWPKRKPLVAECLHRQTWPRRIWRQSQPHDSPEPRCECGIYGADLSLVRQYLTPAPFEPKAARVLGRVSLWDTVIECERGYRASYAYPLFIYIPLEAARDDVVTGLRGYGVPVQVLSLRCADAAAALARLQEAAHSG